MPRLAVYNMLRHSVSSCNTARLPAGPDGCQQRQQLSPVNQWLWRPASAAQLPGCVLSGGGGIRTTSAAHQHKVKTAHSPAPCILSLQVCESCSC
jgi:hypothetical protein